MIYFKDFKANFFVLLHGRASHFAGVVTLFELHYLVVCLHIISYLYTYFCLQFNVVFTHEIAIEHYRLRSLKGIVSRDWGKL
jgi:hypothetical protein